MDNSTPPRRETGLTRSPSLSAQPRVLVLSQTRAAREVLSARLGGAGLAVQASAAMPDAGTVLQRERPDVVLFHAANVNDDAIGLIRTLSTQPGVSVVVVAEKPSLDVALAAMRAGAADLLDASTEAGELARRVVLASQRARELATPSREMQAKLRRLRKICRELHSAREQVSAQVGSLCEELARAYGDIAERASHAAVAGEFNGVLRQELDLETLLRVALEFVLAKSGPTNAAIFLPSTTGDFSLGAYVNCDGPRDTAEILLDHLCQAVAPRFENTEGVTLLSGREELTERLGEAADWIGDANLLAFPCRHEDECLAVVTLFRPARQEFPSTFTDLLPVLADLFAKQLARVIKIHHRHIPKHQWGAGDADDLDLSA
jgi:DNA-binding response OmpR family regulator